MKETARLVSVAARPEPLGIDLSRTAVVVVDMHLIRWRAEWANAVNTALADAGRP